MNKETGFENSLLVPYMRHQSVIRRRPHAGVSIGGKLAGMFVENQMLVERRDKATIDFLVQHLDGEPLPSKPLPERPRALHAAKPRDIRDMPEMITVRIRGDQISLAPLERLLDRNAVKEFGVSSRAGAGTIAASLLLRDEGLGGQLNLTGTTASFPLSSSIEGFPSDINAMNGRSTRASRTSLRPGCYAKRLTTCGACKIRSLSAYWIADLAS